MSTSNEDQAVADNSAYNPFPEPQTIPAGWDTSTFFSSPEVDSVMDEEAADES